MRAQVEKSEQQLIHLRSINKIIKRSIINLFFTLISLNSTTYTLHTITAHDLTFFASRSSTICQSQCQKSRCIANFCRNANKFIKLTPMLWL